MSDLAVQLLEDYGVRAFLIPFAAICVAVALYYEFWRK